VGLEIDIISFKRLVIFDDSLRSFRLGRSLRSRGYSRRLLIGGGLGVWDVFLEETKDRRSLFLLRSCGGSLRGSLLCRSCSFSWSRGIGGRLDDIG
jgi:hypothetical protein